MSGTHITKILWNFSNPTSTAKDMTLFRLLACFFPSPPTTPTPEERILLFPQCTGLVAFRSPHPPADSANGVGTWWELMHTQITTVVSLSALLRRREEPGDARLTVVGDLFVDEIMIFPPVQDVFKKYTRRFLSQNTLLCFLPWKQLTCSAS